jgi:hypothetical protein
MGWVSVLLSDIYDSGLGKPVNQGVECDGRTGLRIDNGSRSKRQRCLLDIQFFGCHGASPHEH